MDLTEESQDRAVKKSFSWISSKGNIDIEAPLLTIIYIFWRNLSKIISAIGHFHLIDSHGTLHDHENSTHAGYIDFNEVLAAMKPIISRMEWWCIDFCFNAHVEQWGKEAVPHPRENSRGGLMGLRFGCQTYTWQMSYEKYANLFPKILGTIEQAGFAGVEPEVCMLGPYRHNPQALAQDLEARNLKLGAVTLALPWNGPAETEEEKEEAKFVFQFLKHFPDTLLMLVNLPGKDRSNLHARQQNALTCVNAVAMRAAEQGINCAFHPNSPLGSIFRNACRVGNRINIQKFFNSRMIM